MVPTISATVFSFENGAVDASHWRINCRNSIHHPVKQEVRLEQRKIHGIRLNGNRSSKPAATNSRDANRSDVSANINDCRQPAAPQYLNRGEELLDVEFALTI